MNKAAIIAQLQTHHQEFIATIQGLSEDNFMYAPLGKWTPGQHLEHIYKSVRPLVKVLQALASGVIPYFEALNRPSRTYTESVAAYQAALQGGGVATEAFIPQAVDWADKDGWITRLQEEVQKLVDLVTGYEEDYLDTTTIPHPLLGGMTLREMLYFTAYHVTHHQKSVQQYFALPTHE